MDRTWTAAALVAVVLAAGCGGGGSGGAPDMQGPGGPDVPSDPIEPASASSVIGQADFTSRFINRGRARAAADSLSNPFGPVAVLPGERFAIPDWGNNRVLIFGARLETGVEASVALGQPDLESSGIAVDRGTHPGAEFVAVGGGRMAVVNLDAHRVNVYNATPADANSLPDVVVGQDQFDTSDYGCDQRSFNLPNSAAWLPDGRLVVVDGANHRVLVYDNDWRASGKSAVLVLGQRNLDHCASNDHNGDGVSESRPDASTMNSPGGLWTDGEHLVVVDGGNHRVLIWNTFPTTHAQPADLVLGQPDAETATVGPPSRRSLKEPYMGVDFDGAKLAISDTGNHRVLIWNGFPATNHQPADEVIGQATFETGASNDSDGDGIEGPGPTGRTFSQPAGLKFHQGRLFVTDSLNHRVLVFDK